MVLVCLVGAVDNLFESKKRRWIDVSLLIMFEYNIKLMQKNCDNVYAKAVYTESIWRAVHSIVIKTDQLPEVRHMKAAYTVEEGNALLF